MARFLWRLPAADAPAQSEPAERRYASLPYRGLQKACKALGLSAGGSKGEMIRRLEAYCPD